MTRRILTLLYLLALPLRAQDGDEAAEAAAAFGLDEAPAEFVVTGDDEEQTVAQLAARLRPALAVITVGGRTGGTARTGSGFVVSADGLVATAAHVIEPGRDIVVRLGDGREHAVSAVHAWDQKLDLALLKIDATGLKPLPLADADTLEQGQEVIAIGNPHGLEYSVVHGVVSALRDLESEPAIQLAMAIEPGNSGGPLLDMSGRVHGIVNMKSRYTDFLGFAVAVADLHRLIASPNRVAIDKWMTIGQLDPGRWKAIMGARWTQRAGRIKASTAGTGFGGRSLCIYQREVPETPYELAVEVRLDDESGAAGLAFESDGGDVHYGFYPSAGGMRLTRFEGPDVTSWNILEQFETKAYRAGDWNRVRVRVGKEKITGWVNGEQVFERAESALRGGRVGLAKFRGTVPEFRRFELGADLAKEEAAPELVAEIDALIDAGGDGALDALVEHPTLAGQLLTERAKSLRAEADALVARAAAVHRRATSRELVAVLDADAADALPRAALLLAKLDNPELDIAAYLEEIERMAGEVLAKLAGAGDDIDDATRVEAVREYLFEDSGFRGSLDEYYSRSNSYLNEVIDDREGLPITLSLLFVELGRRAGADLHGLPLPGHFVVYYTDGEERKLIDPFDRGSDLGPAEASALIAAAGYAGTAADFPPAEPRGVIQRMLNNLKAIAIDEQDTPSALRYVNVLLDLDPDDAQERLSRALLNVQNGTGEAAKPDLEWLFEKRPEGIHVDRLRDLYERL